MWMPYLLPETLLIEASMRVHYTILWAASRAWHRPIRVALAFYWKGVCYRLWFCVVRQVYLKCWTRERAFVFRTLSEDLRPPPSPYFLTWANWRPSFSIIENSESCWKIVLIYPRLMCQFEIRNHRSQEFSMVALSLLLDTRLVAWLTV